MIAIIEQRKPKPLGVCNFDMVIVLVSSSICLSTLTCEIFASGGGIFKNIVKLNDIFVAFGVADIDFGGGRPDQACISAYLRARRLRETLIPQW